MKCHEVEIRLVHALDGENGSPVDEHLEQCESCRAFYAELLADRDALQALASADISDEAVQQLQRRVMQQIPRKSRGLWWVPVAAVAAAVLVAVALWPAEKVVAPPSAIVASVKPTEIAWQRSKPQPAPRPKPAIRQQRREQPLWVKLETPDPNVIIYWMVEQKGEME
jgi:anti-sigma factor RsiW